MLSVTVKEGGYVMIGDDILVKYVCDVSGDQIRIGIQAPKDYKISRDDVFEKELKKKIDAKQIDISELEKAKKWRGNQKQRNASKSVV